MSTAAVGIGRGIRGTKPRNRSRARVYVERPGTRESFVRFFRRAARPTLLIGLFGLLAALAAFAYFYNYYSAAVEHRMRSGFWQSRGGVYAAPYKLHVGRRTSIETIVDRLKRAGYVEGGAADQIWNGSFTVRENALFITANSGFGKTEEEIEIKFAGNKISGIKRDLVPVEEHSIDPEMLIGRTETKRTGAHVLQFEDIPENLKNAILIAEDRRFFSHYGLDPRGIARALWTNVANGGVTQGGSTLTQQLVKNTFLTPERSFKRKFAEAFLAIAVERNMTKEQIFALYCNEIYLGQYGSTGIHGIRQAANAYFGKELKDLTLAESAAIAAMIKNPNHYGPHRDKDASRVRREAIVNEMAANGLASSSELAAATEAELNLAPPKKQGNAIAPYFVDAATREIESKFQGDYLNANFNTRVYTTIDTHLQSLAENAVANHLAKLNKVYSKKGIKPQAALVALDPQTGHVLALVGGRDYVESQFNRATDAMRQPGSTFKPFVYATALERGYKPTTLLADAPTEFMQIGGKAYKPKNYGDSYAGTNITLKTALAKSSNVVAVKTAYEAGLHNVASKAAEFGFENVQSYPSMALGTFEVTPMQLAAAYATFANGGRRVVPTYVDKIVSGDEDLLYISVPSDEQVIDEKVAYMMTDMLQAVVERGTARSANGTLGKHVVFAGKTGSSKDGWFVGYTPNLVTAVWVGVDDSTDVRSTGGEIALPMWSDFMQAAVQSRPEYGGDSFPMPAGMTRAVIDPTTGMLADSHCPMREEVVMPRSQISNSRCGIHQPMPNVYVAETIEVPAFEDTIIEIPAVPSELEEIRPHIDEADEQREKGRKREKRKVGDEYENWEPLNVPNLPDGSQMLRKTDG